MIYIASPYTHEDKDVENARFSAVYDYTTRLMQLGVVCFSPIVYGRQFHVDGRSPGDFDYWRDFNESILIGCAEMHVLRLEGLEKSKGVRHEIDFANKNGIRMRFIKP